jgi:hypothetical protein
VSFAPSVAVEQCGGCGGRSVERVSAAVAPDERVLWNEWIVIPRLPTKWADGRLYSMARLGMTVISGWKVIVVTRDPPDGTSERPPMGSKGGVLGESLGRQASASAVVRPAATRRTENSYGLGPAFSIHRRHRRRVREHSACGTFR